MRDARGRPCATEGSHVPFRAQGEAELDAEVDYVVVGSGAGGATAAVTLARGGARVALVEAGAWRDPEDYPLSTYGALRDLMDDWGTLMARGRALWPIVQARTMGGTTVVNSAICVRTPEDVFARWTREQGLPDLRGPVLAAEDRIESELGVEEVPPLSRGRSNTLAKLGGDRLAWSDSHYMRRYTKGCQGAGQCLQGCKGLRKQSTNLNYIPETRARGGLIVSSAPVDRILSEGTRATGVTGRFVHPRTRRIGTRFRVSARRGVVVAASVTQSPLLLMRSGVKSHALGRYFRAHPGTGIFGCYDDPVDMNIGATQGWASIAFRETQNLKLETLALPPELVASRFAGGGTELMKRLEEYRHTAMWVLAVRAESTGTIRPSLFGSKPVVSYELDRRDMETLRRGLVLVARQHFAAGAKAIIPGIAGLPFRLGKDDLGVIENAPLDPQHYVAVMSHLFGGCVMGVDPKTSVVDVHGRVHGWDGLVVADASVIPSTLGVNPQHTIMGLSSTFAERLLDS